MFEKKAKIIIFFFMVVSPFFGLYAESEILQHPLIEKIDLEPHEDELIVIERVIEHTEKLQLAQKKLKELILDLKHNKEIFIKGEQSKLHAKYMIQAAKESLKIIRHYHLQHLFSSDFIEELAVLNQIGAKEGLIGNP